MESGNEPSSKAGASGGRWADQCADDGTTPGSAVASVGSSGSEGERDAAGTTGLEGEMINEHDLEDMAPGLPEQPLTKEEA